MRTNAADVLRPVILVRGKVVQTGKSHIITVTSVGTKFEVSPSVREDMNSVTSVTI